MLDLGLGRFHSNTDSERKEAKLNDNQFYLEERIHELLNITINVHVNY